MSLRAITTSWRIALAHRPPAVGTNRMEGRGQQRLRSVPAAGIVSGISGPLGQGCGGRGAFYGTFWRTGRW